MGHDAVPVREPGGTRLGEEVRRWVKGVEVAPEAELLLFAAARAELVAEVVRPALAAGKVVIADRYADSTMAYQGYGRRLPLDLVRAVNRAATGGLMPEITFLLDQPVEQGLARVDDAGQSRFEREGIAFHRRVRSGFLKLAGEEPRRILVVDAAQPAERIAAAVWERVQPLLAGAVHP